MKRIDLTGKTFGRLTVLGFSHNNARGQAYWVCKCECGAQSTIRGSHLKSGLIKSCGCLRKESPHMQRQDLVGAVFGQLTVTRYSHTINGNTYWECQCSCGNSVVVNRNHMITGDTKSCGCLRQDQCSKLGKILHLGEAHHHWNGGIREHDGYTMITVKGHPRSDMHGYVREHIIIAEKALGKPLPAKAEIHHVNTIRNDNRPTNLVICPDHAYHMLLHRRAKAKGHYDRVEEAHL